jgi:putative two-component system response regulator
MFKILIVDDDEDTRDEIADFLETVGYDCTLAPDVRRARSCLKTQEFQLILSDLNMPGESGLDLLRHASSNHPDTPVILMSGYQDPRMADIALKMGAHAYLMKPFRIADLLAHMSSALRCPPVGYRPPGDGLAQPGACWVG